MTSSSLLNARLLRTTALGVSIAVAAVSAPAFAQDATTDNAEDTANAIVVTAQGRSQLLSDVPVAISAVSAETLQNSGATDIRQLNPVTHHGRHLPHHLGHITANLPLQYQAFHQQADIII